MQTKFVVKTRTFEMGKFSTKPELTGVHYTVMTASEEQVIAACMKSQEDLVTHQLMGPVSDRDAEIILSGKDEDRIREIAMKASETFQKALSEVPF